MGLTSIEGSSYIVASSMVPRACLCKVCVFLWVSLYQAVLGGPRYFRCTQQPAPVKEPIFG